MSEEELKKQFMESASEPMKAYWRRERPIEIRPVSLRHYVTREKLEPVQHVWFRASGPLPDDAAIHKCVLAYASDMMLLDTSLYPHARTLFDRDLQVASLDHALWFHLKSARRLALYERKARPPPAGAASTAAPSTAATGPSPRWAGGLIALGRQTRARWIGRIRLKEKPSESPLPCNIPGPRLCLGAPGRKSVSSATRRRSLASIS